MIDAVIVSAARTLIGMGAAGSFEAVH